jgi:hypothetical protein
VYASRIARTDFSNSEELSILLGRVSVFQTFEFDAEPGFFDGVHPFHMAWFV